jgi:hypothetical protein
VLGRMWYGVLLVVWYGADKMCTLTGVNSAGQRSFGSPTAP